MGGPITSQGRQQETFLFSSPCLPTFFFFFFLPPLTQCHLLREQLVPPSVAHMARQTPYWPPSPSTSSAQKVLLLHCLLCHHESPPLPSLSLHLHSSVHPLSSAQMDESLGFPGMLYRGTIFQLWMHQFSSVQSLSHVRLFATPWIAACQASLSITNSQSLLKLMSIELVGDAIQPSHPLSSPSPPAPNPSKHQSFPMSQLFTWGGQSIGVSASVSVLPMNTQDWSSLGWTGWISLQSKGLSRVFSTDTTVQKHQSSSDQRRGGGETPTWCCHPSSR